LTARHYREYNNPNRGHARDHQRSDQVVESGRLVAFVVMHRANAKCHANNIQRPDDHRDGGTDHQAKLRLVSEKVGHNAKIRVLSASFGSASEISIIQNMRALLNQHLNLLTAQGTLVKINHLAFWLMRILVVSLDEFDAFLVASGTAPQVWGMLVDVGGRVVHNELITTARTVVVPRLRIRKCQAFRLVRPAGSTDYGVTS
jgi:hypothetical protein